MGILQMTSSGSFHFVLFLTKPGIKAEMPDLKSSQVPSVHVELAPPLENFPRGLQLKLTGQSSNSEIRTTKSLNITGYLRPGSKATLD